LSSFVLRPSWVRGDIVQRIVQARKLDAAAVFHPSDEMRVHRHKRAEIRSAHADFLTIFLDDFEGLCVRD
jgi:hypothetical protein